MGFPSKKKHSFISRRAGGMYEIRFINKGDKLCGKQVNVMSCTTYEQAVVAGEHARAEFIKRHPLGDVPRREGVTDGMINIWIKEVRESVKKVAEQWAEDNSEAIAAAGDVQTYDQQRKIPCAYCNGAPVEDGGCGVTYMCNKNFDMRFFASPKCALKMLGYIMLPTGEEYCEDIESDGSDLKVVTRGVSHDNGNWTVSNLGQLCPTWEERLLEKYRGTEEGMSAVAAVNGFNAISRVRRLATYDPVKKATYREEVIKPREAAAVAAANAKAKGDDCLKFVDCNINEPEYAPVSDLVDKQRKLARKQYPSEEYILLNYAWKGTSDLENGSFVVRYGEWAKTQTNSFMCNIILCPNDDNKTGTNFLQSQFVLIGGLATSKPLANSMIPCMVTWDVFESNQAAFRREEEFTSALKGLPDMSNPKVPEVVINETGGGNGGKAKKPGFPVAGFVTMAFRKGQFGFNASRQLSKELVSKLPEDCGLVMLEMDASKKALVERKKKWTDDRKAEKAAAETRRAKAKLVIMNSERGTAVSPNNAMNVPSDSKETAAKPAAVAAQAVKPSKKILTLPPGSSKPNGKAKEFVKPTKSAPIFSLNAASCFKKNAEKKAEKKEVKEGGKVKLSIKVDHSFFAKRKSSSTVGQLKSPPELSMNKKMKGSEDEA